MSSASPPRRAQYFRCVRSLASAIFGAAPRSHLALGQIENPGAVSALRHLEQRAAAGLLHIVAVSGQGKNIERCGRTSVQVPLFQHNVLANDQAMGRHLLQCGQDAAHVFIRINEDQITGNFPPASTRWLVFTRCRPRNPATACNAVAA